MSGRFFSDYFSLGQPLSYPTDRISGVLNVMYNKEGPLGKRWREYDQQFGTLKRCQINARKCYKARLFISAPASKRQPPSRRRYGGPRRTTDKMSGQADALQDASRHSVAAGTCANVLGGLRHPAPGVKVGKMKHTAKSALVRVCPHIF